MSIDNSAVSGHLRLEKVARLIADRSCAAVSFDIFDTILWRRTPRPADLFGLVAARLREAGKCPAWISDAAFRRMRIAAERDSRSGQDALGSEVSLFGIWRAMPLSLFPDATLDELVRAEVDTERELTEVDLDIAEIIRLAKDHDLPIVLVSDTYFTEEQLGYLLDRPELEALKSARVFRSHEHGVDKASGLWDVVLSDLGRRPEQILHVGDNPVADVEVPGELGIRTVHYERADEGLQQILEREGEPEDPFGPYAPDLDPEHGDFGITSLRAKTLQASRPDGASSARFAWRYGAAVTGPVLAGFAEWVAKKAHDDGIKVLWCPMREGELLSELIGNAAAARGWDVTAKPVWLSRQVTSIAALDSADRDSIREFVRKRHQLTVRQLLGMLHLRAGEVPHLAEDLDMVLDTDEMVGRLAVALTETPHLVNRLAVTATAARERLIRSLREAGALDGPDLTLVDLGWGGTIQLQLARVLRLARIDIEPAGLYLATDDRSEKVLLAGLRAEGFLGQAGHPREIVGAIVRSPEVLEQSVNALCGSLIDFTEDGKPVLGVAAGSDAQNAERSAVQDGIRAFQRQWNRYVSASDGAWPTLAGTARDRLANILVSALKLPTAEEASVFGNWEHEDNFGSDMVTRVLPEDLVPAVPYLSPSDLDDLRMRDSFWPALLAASDPHLGAAARAVRTGAIDPAMFEPAGEPSATSVRFRTTEGEWFDGADRRVRINHNGLSFARMDVEAADIEEIALAVPGRPALARVDWIETRVIAGGRPQVLRWNTSEDFARLHYEDCTWLGANMVEFHSPLAAIWLPLAARAGAPVSSFQLTVAFAMLPRSRSGLGHRMPAAGRSQRLSAKVRNELREHGPGGLAAGAARIAVRRLRSR
ncbi:HAD family hydrolase [Amycolatopsis umgeniensis]|uniref:Putative HAD superfamily hydrolase n=1 Tax=Amycolatopsis umgeniensis TaxID=336628 RepID=A0A841B2M8_9PSEU|nr:HAD family hydrolase [Amycolatopsis umgeniensis]MBB5852862.1 putative HAD superfamily hydrolase [Amycolatopsis umgeniensis]